MNKPEKEIVDSVRELKVVVNTSKWFGYNFIFICVSSFKFLKSANISSKFNILLLIVLLGFYYIR